MAAARTRQRDIAERAGVHVATVSMALRDHPRISESTRQRVLKIAKELGYSPDPMLSALAAYRDRRRPTSYHGTLAWLSDSSAGFDWQASDHYTRYFSGARARAIQSGYQVEAFDLRASDFTPQRARTVFCARNITGLLVCPHPTGYAGIDFPWDEFSLMTFGYSVIRPTMHAVASAHYRNTRRAMREVAARGYLRPGLVLPRDKGLSNDFNIPAAYAVEQYIISDGARIPPFFDPEKNSATFKKWLRKYRVDVILTVNHLVPLLRKTGLCITGDTGFVNLSLPTPDRTISGILEDDEKIGAVAVEHLVSMIHRGERGIPSDPLRTHLEGTWNEGTTLPHRF